MYPAPDALESIDFSEFLATSPAQGLDDSIPPPPLEILLGLPTPDNTQGEEEQQQLQPFNFTSQTPPLSTPFQPTYILPAIIHRPASELGQQRVPTAKLLLHTLKSYPLMMLRRDAAPPFIHPRFVSLADNDDGKDDADHPEREPLNNCIALLHMVGSRLPGSRKLFWRNVRTECERFLERHGAASLECDRWETLFACQALLMYVILRLDEGARGDATGEHVDVSLVAAVTVSLFFYFFIFIFVCQCPLGCLWPLKLTYRIYNTTRESLKNSRLFARVVIGPSITTPLRTGRIGCLRSLDYGMLCRPL